MSTVSGQIVDVVNKRIFPGEVHFQNGHITKLIERAQENSQFVIPGLIDAHIHIESSMLIPEHFAKLAVRHGTVGTVSDPHEIANVLGIQGVEYMLENARRTPFKFSFGAPSCVPASAFESSGAVLGVKEVEALLRHPEIKSLAEMMNFPGVLNGDDVVMAKIAIARELGMVIDGHAPGLKGEDARKYAEAGISTDHECFTIEEALDKIKFDMKIAIREGSAAKNFDALVGLFDQHPDVIMFCSDDKHPDDLLLGHINQLVSRAVKLGKDPITVLRAATYTPVKHYDLPVGLLQVGDPADLVVVDSLENMQIKATYINGELVAKDGKDLLPAAKSSIINNFNRDRITINDLALECATPKARVIEIIPGQLMTNELILSPKKKGELVVSDPERDILKLVVVNRYDPKATPAVGLVRGAGLKRGAIASSVAHDSHNIIAAGVNDADIMAAINLVIERQGGLSLADGEHREILDLPLAGLMSTEPGEEVAAKYIALREGAQALGSELQSCYMALSFLALSVIPKIKLTDQGLFNGEKFELVGIEVAT